MSADTIRLRGAELSGKAGMEVEAARPGKRGRRVRIFGRYVLLTVLAFVVLFPIYITIVNSVLRPAQIAARPPTLFPTHPLFGRRFALLSTRPRPHSVGYIFVVYRNTMVLRLPQAVTSLVASPPESESMTKLTSHAVTELISFAEQCEVLCPAIQPNSGIDSPPRGKPVSAPTSRRSSRR